MFSFGNLTHWYEWCLLAVTIAQLFRVYIVSHRDDLEADNYDTYVPAIMMALLLYCMMP